MNKKSYTAFSLIEISIVIIIIGILIAGIIKAREMISKANISSARALSQSSDVSSIKNLVFWIDAAKYGSLTNTNDLISVSEGDYIKSWADVNPQSINPFVFRTSAANTYPIYRVSALNGLPTLEFDGSSVSGQGDYLETADEPRINQPNDHSIFVVFAPLTGISSNSQIGIIGKRTPTDASNQSYSLLYDSANFRPTAIVTHASTNFLSVTTSNSITENIASVVSVTHNTANTVSGYEIFVNGNSVGTRDPAPFVNSTAGLLRIGGQKANTSDRFCKCYISEIIMYDRALKNEERNDVTQYLGKKWKIPVS